MPGIRIGIPFIYYGRIGKIMNTKLRVALLLLLMLFSSIIILANRKKEKEYNSSSGIQIDLTKMLQFGEHVNEIKLTDRYGRTFNLDDFCNGPILLVFIRKKLQDFKAYEDSLHKCLKVNIAKGLNIVFICFEDFGQNSKRTDLSVPNTFCDTNRMDGFKAFKVYNHSSCIILDKKHNVVLATTRLLTHVELDKIFQYKKSAFWGYE
jgi:hypothetical protein